MPRKKKEPSRPGVVILRKNKGSTKIILLNEKEYLEMVDKNPEDIISVRIIPAKIGSKGLGRFEVETPYRDEPSDDTIRVQYYRSSIGYSKKQKEIVKSLGIELRPSTKTERLRKYIKRGELKKEVREN